ncbi:glycosyltransferase family 4 protein [Rhizobium leguminosarum]|nr:glycosyltransferase family 4 protein [Rhizobium leguminosarum]
MKMSLENQDDVLSEQTDIDVSKCKVLVFCDYYLPGYKGGGPITTIRNLVTRLGNEIDFSIFTRSNDLGETTSYSDVPHDLWHLYAGASVRHATPENLTVPNMRRMLREKKPDVVYINSLLSRKFSLLPLIAIRLEGRQMRVVIAPRGELSGGALALKQTRKRVYLAILRASGLLRSVVWQASSQFEEMDIRSVMGRAATVVVAPDLPSIPLEPAGRQRKAPGEAQIVFVGRISPMKNLVGALNVLRSLSGNVIFSIIGPVEDEDYWAVCKRKLAMLPDNIRVDVLGPQSPESVLASLSRFDAFFLPSLGENYAHVVFESLGAGCPVILSNRTPWRGLAEKGVGVDVPLEAPEAMSAALQQIIDMNENEHLKMRTAAKAYAQSILADGKDVQASLALFDIRIQSNGQ